MSIHCGQGVGPLLIRSGSLATHIARRCTVINNPKRSNELRERGGSFIENTELTSIR